MPIRKEYTFTYRDISDRKRKNLVIFNNIRRHGEISRTDISKETDINIVSVSNYVTSYLKKNLVLECGRDISTGGRRPELVRLNLENVYVAGIDIGPERLVAVITDLSLKVKAKIVENRPKGNMDKVIESAINILEKLFKQFGAPLSNIKLVGMGVSGVVDIHSGPARDTDPARGKTQESILSLIKILKDKFDITALVGNDATCAAFGELSLNLDTNISEMLYIYSDIGCGIIINRDIYCGASGKAGEIQLLANNHTKGSKAHAEEIASYGVRGVDLGVVQKAKDLINKNEDSKILKAAGGKKDAITRGIIFEASKANDKLAIELLIDAAYWLGIKIAYLINIFNPQLVLIGGGMEVAGSVFMEALNKCAKMYSYEETFDAVKIMPSFLGEDAVALGAVSLAARELFIDA